MTGEKVNIDWKKARLIASRLASDHDGEVIAAARAMVRMAIAAGIRVEDLIAPHTERRDTAYPTRTTDTRQWDAAAAFTQASGFGDAFHILRRAHDIRVKQEQERRARAQRGGFGS